MSFNHFDDEGRAHMVDVTGKEPTVRQATATATVKLGRKLLTEVLDRNLTKGDVLGVARLAGINAVKRTSELIPLAHPLAIGQAAIDFKADEAEGTIQVICSAKALEKTGVEMEAMTGATVAALTIYDMCKGRDKSISIDQVRLLFKSGGKSGVFQAEGEVSK